MTQSRRAFLERLSAAAAAGMLAQLPARRLWATIPAVELLPEPDEPLLRELAHQAMDAARAAGASFADIRLTAGRQIEVACGYRAGGVPHMSAPSVALPIGYGIRVIVDGAWGFAGGTDLATDVIVERARAAVALARGNRPRHRRTLELAPVDPVPNGTWETPIQRDPLTVPIGEQVELALAALEEASKVKGVVVARTEFQWRRPTTVFATTDGTTLTMRYASARPSGVVGVSIGPELMDEGGAVVEGVRSGPYGYEALNGTAIIAGMRVAAERAIEEVKAARHATSVQVGRYDLVLASGEVARILTATLANALNAERALGYTANGSGTSFAAPPAAMLGTYRIASPLITVRGDRTRPGGACTVPWDEEGVKPREYTFVQDGVIVDYHTNRETAPQLADWYRRRGEPVRAHGIMRRCGSHLPSIMLPNLTMEPGPGSTTVEDLLQGVKKGLYIEQMGRGGSDQQLMNTQYAARYTGVRAITNGKLGGYVKDVAFQFITTPFWKSIDAIGGRPGVKTLTSATDGAALNDPLQPFPFSTIDVVPVRVRQVNVFNTGRTA